MIEQIRPGVTASKARFVLFDFDGTVSLIRSGWVEVMVPMMVEILAGLRTGESDEELRALVEEFVARLTGKQTMYQMIELARQEKVKLPSYSVAGLRELVFKDSYRDLPEYLHGFAYTCAVLRNPENVERVARIVSRAGIPPSAG